MSDETNQIRIDHVEETLEESKADRKDLHNQLDDLRDEFRTFREEVQMKVNMANAIIQMGKFVLYILAALAALKWPDIADIAKRVFS